MKIAGMRAFYSFFQNCALLRTIHPSIYLFCFHFNRLRSSIQSVSLSVSLLVHKAEKYVQVDLVVFATCHDLVYDRLQVLECLNVRDVKLCQRLTVQLPRVLLDILGHVKQAL